MRVEIEKLDHQGQGIAYIDNIVTFIPKTIPKDIVEVEIVEKKKKYQKGRVTKYIKRGHDFKESFCPFYALCGGCNLENYSYEKTIEYKKEKIKNLFLKKNIDISPIVIENPMPKNYRNKIELKVKNKEVGFYEKRTNKLVRINECFITNKAINKVIPFINTWNINNGKITIRCNKNEEILIIIETKDTIKVDVEELKKEIKLVGIVYNNNSMYGQNFLYERMNGLLFRYSYDAFFQVNPYVAEKLFSLIEELVKEDKKILDLYSGVGTLALSASKIDTEVYGIEIIPNAVLNAINNAKLNNKDKTKFLLNDVEKAIDKIKMDFDVWIIDPPRSGIDKKTLETMLKNKPKKIIYVSCDALTLIRDIEALNKIYEVEKVYILDMFSYTYHTECICVLKIR